MTDVVVISVVTDVAMSPLWLLSQWYWSRTYHVCRLEGLFPNVRIAMIALHIFHILHTRPISSLLLNLNVVLCHWWESFTKWI